MTARCPHCDAPTTGDGRCPSCGAGAVGLSGASLVEKYSRQIEAARRAWEGPPRPAPAAVPEERAPYQRLAAGAAGPALEARTPGVLNLLLLHAGYSPWTSLRLAGGGLPRAGAAASRLAIRFASRPAAFEPRTVAITDPAGPLEPPVVSPDYGFFFALDEAVRAELEAEAVHDGHPLARKSLEVTVHTANEWIDRPGCEAALAGAVTPNAPAVAGFVGSLEEDFLAYQAQESRRIEREVAGLYDVLRRLDLRYLGAPPSYEGSGQKVLFPDQVLASRRGCCLDLAVLQAALLERLGYNPLIVLLRDGGRRWGHACCGVWTSDLRSRSPVLDDRAVVEQAVTDGDLLLWNPTQPYERAGDGGFAAARRAGERLLSYFQAALDVAACRAQRFKPVPRKAP